MAFDITKVIGRSGRVYKENNSPVNEGDILEGGIGKYSLELSGTDKITPTAGYYIFCIVPSSAMVVADQTDIDGAINADLTAITEHPASTPIYTNLADITLTSGDGIAYLLPTSS